MFELSVAFKYLIPRWRQLSVSLISMISMLVIALVVWLIVVFFSVTHGLEKMWIGKLIALTAPVRVTPTEAYYSSYYYLIDSVSQDSDYDLKTLGEKRLVQKSDPYNPEFDEELSATWPKPDRDASGELKDLVQIAFQEIESLPGVKNLQARDYEMTASKLALRLIRPEQFGPARISQTSYIGSFDDSNTSLAKALLPLTEKDLSNLLRMSGISAETPKEDHSDFLPSATSDVVKARLKSFFSYVNVHELKTPEPAWTLPTALLPQSAEFSAIALSKGKKLRRIFLPQQKSSLNESLIKEAEQEGYLVEKVAIQIDNGKILVTRPNQPPTPLPSRIPLTLEENIPLKARLETASLEKAEDPSKVQFFLEFAIQGIEMKGIAPWGHWKFSEPR